MNRYTTRKNHPISLYRESGRNPWMLVVSAYLLNRSKVVMWSGRWSSWRWERRAERTPVTTLRRVGGAAEEWPSHVLASFLKQVATLSPPVEVVGDLALRPSSSSAAQEDRRQKEEGARGFMEEEEEAAPRRRRESRLAEDKVGMAEIGRMNL